MELALEFYPYAKKSLENFLSGSFSRDYAVVDFDNTTSFGDSQWTLFDFQTLELAYLASPSEMEKILLCEMTDKEKESKIPGFPFSYNDLKEDILAAYRCLWDKGFIGLNQEKRKDGFAEERKEFAGKMHLLMQAIEKKKDPDYACRFISYPFQGFSSQQYYDLSQQAHTSKALSTLKDGIRIRNWDSSRLLKSRCGFISVSQEDGFLVPAEISELYWALYRKGIDLYIVSSSHYEVIKAAAENPLFHLPPFKGIFAFQCEKDEKGKYLASYNEVKHPQTFGEGKKEAVLKEIAPLYGMKAPVFLAGDSDGDFPLLSAFPARSLVLIFNRRRTEKLIKLKKEALKEEQDKSEPFFLLQGRDTPHARFWPSAGFKDAKGQVFGAEEEPIQ